MLALVLLFAQVPQTPKPPKPDKNHEVWHNLNKGKWEAKVSIPRLNGNSDVQRLAQASIRAEALKFYNDFLKEAKEDWNDPQYKPNSPFDFEVTSTVYLNTPKMVSVTCDIYQDMAGAHPYGFTTCYVFAKVGGKAKKLVYSDILQQGAIATIVLPQVNKQKDERQMDHLDTIPPEEIERFFVTSKGIEWVFPQYVLGSYAEGVYEAKATWAQLKPYLKANFAR